MMKNSRTACLYALTLVLFAFGSLFAQAQKPTASAPKDRVIPLDPKVKMGKLSNGLTYYIQKNTEPQKRAELYLVINTGSTAEDDDQQGLAHFTEHMAFNGTRDFPKNELISYLQKAGVRFGADLNAYTSFNETVYQLPVPTDSVAIFKKGFTILANWAGYITFNNEDIDAERGVIVEEERQRGKNASERMQKQLLPVLLGNSRYNERLPIGKTEIINSFKYETIRKYYKDWYRPDLQAVIAIGDFDPAEVEKLIRDNFSGFKNPKKERAHKTYPLPLPAAPVVKVVTDPEFAYTVANVMYMQPGIVTKTEAAMRKSIMVYMINIMFGNRMQEIMQSGNAPFVRGSGSFGPFQGGMGDIDAFSVGAMAKDADGLKAALQGVLDEAVRMKTYGFTASELDRARQSLLSSVERQYNEREKTPSSSIVRQYIQHFLRGSASPGIEYQYAFYKENVPGITLEEVNKLASTLMPKDNYIAIIQAGEKDKAKLPDENTYKSWIQEAGKNVQPYKDEVLASSLMETKPVAGTILSEKKLATTDATEWKLSNGVTVILKTTDFKNDQILVNAFSPGGTSLAPDADFYSDNFASDLISGSGVASFSDTQLNKMLAGKVVGVEPFISEYFEGVSGSTTPKDAETLFQLISLYFTQPRKDTSVFKVSMDRYKVSLSGRASDPNAIYQDTIRAILSNYNFRGMTPTISNINTINLDKALSFYKERFANASDFVFVIVGNFKPEEIKPLVLTYVASLPGKPAKETYVDRHITPKPGALTRNVYAGLEDKAVVSMFYHGTYAYDNKNNLMLDLVQAVLKDKLTERLREKEGGVYSPGTDLSISKIPTPHYTITVRFSCSTANISKLVNATLDEVKKLKENGASQEDIEKYAAQEKRQFELQLRQNNFWLGYLGNIYLGVQDENYVAEYTKLLGEITPEMTKAAAQKFFNDNNLKQIILSPKEKP